MRITVESPDQPEVIDLIAELEVKTNVVIPTSEIRNEVFASVDSIAQMLVKLSEQA